MALTRVQEKGQDGGDPVSDAGDGEIELLKSRIDALELERTRLREFAALAAHELLRPVIIAQECAARLMEGDQGALDDAAQADLELLRTVSSQVRVLVDTLLADAQRGESALDGEPVDLARVVRDCLRVLAPEIEAGRLRVRLGELPVVAGDAVLLTAVFRNLLVNAIRHGGGRRGEIRVFAEPVDGGWRLAVDSPGSPLSEDDRKALLGTAPRDVEGRRGRGAGLGLVLVRRIVERHGGRLGAMSPDDWTNRFFFTLPADAAQLPASRRR
jgi:signal transduction histidine kinase